MNQESQQVEHNQNHGQTLLTITQDFGHARQVLAQLADVGIDIDQIIQQWEDAGVHKFDVALDQLLQTPEQKPSAALAAPVDR